MRTEMMRYKWRKDAWNGPYDLSRTTFWSRTLWSYAFGK